ncbi:unnamed protein product [Cylicostephanus goldi]|uniref:Uncharacterized protein n=1 Tax=Cylicostephanus goldi TaxID=71465 RepID=A0A3P6RFN3_CYLGO|nr:unnamed protein product [Cylicostephanus goldi]
MIDRYLLSKKLRFKFEKRFHASRRSDILELKRKLENAQFDRLPMGIPIDDSVYIPAKSRVPLEVLQDEHKRWLMQESEDAYSRVVINGKPYSSKEYWRQSLHSRQDTVFIKGNEDGREMKAFASIVLFVYDRATKSLRVLLEEYEFSDPFQHLYEVIQHAEHPLQTVGIELMNTVREHNLFFYELKQSLTRIRPASFIQRSCTYMEYAGRKYASITD